jgi:hypothetical protein
LEAMAGVSVLKLTALALPKGRLLGLAPNL